MFPRVRSIVCGGFAVSAVVAHAAGPPPESGFEVVVVSTTPVAGTGIPLDRVPANVQILRAADLENDHATTLSGAADRHLANVSLADTEGNPFQEDLAVRGFTASPVLGTPQGLALYQNGVRINEAFGDTVLWDFIPVFALATIEELPGSNPVFGLNALGGAVSLQTKTGFDVSGTSAEISGGSFGSVRATAQSGFNFGASAVYLGATIAHEDGWRVHSPSDVAQAFADFALRRGAVSVDTSLTLAASTLNGNGANPVEDDRKAAFAIPDLEQNRLAFLQSRIDAALSDSLSLQATAYLRYAHLGIKNGEASGFSPCGVNLCDGEGDALTDLSGAPLSPELPFTGTLHEQTTATLGFGASLQASFHRRFGAAENAATAGASFDEGDTRFDARTLLGQLVYLTPPGTTTRSDGILIGDSDYNIRLDAGNRYVGLFVTDTLSLTEALSLTVSGRFNLAEINLTDRFGDALNGRHRYSRFNPSAGVTYQIDPALGVYASYSEANRVPTAAELSCADPAQPCRFPLGFVSDPDLHQVVARTVEAGVRGHLPDAGDLRLDWAAAFFVTRNQNDIIFVSAGPLVGSGYFKNAGNTRRIGAELTVQGAWSRFDFRLAYGYVRATYQSDVTILSEFNPGADEDGNIFVHPGNRLPGVPLHTVKLAAGYSLPWGIHLGVDTQLVSSQFLRGDEANLQKPLPGYAVVNAQASWRASDRLSLFVEGENILDRRYDSFGLYNDPTGNGAFPQFANPRFATPGEPFSLKAGARLQL